MFKGQFRHIPVWGIYFGMGLYFVTCLVGIGSSMLYTKMTWLHKKRPTQHPSALKSRLEHWTVIYLLGSLGQCFGTGNMGVTPMRKSSLQESEPVWNCTRTSNYLNVCLCWGFMAQSTQWGHVEHGQFTKAHVYWTGLVLYEVNQYCAHSFARNWQLPFLNQQKGITWMCDCHNSTELLWKGVKAAVEKCEPRSAWLFSYFDQCMIYI